MELLYRSALALVIAMGVVPAGYAADSEALQQQIEALTKRVTALEKRIGILDTPAVKMAIKEASGPQKPGDSSDASNWGFLKVGYNYAEVRELLGEPVSIKRGGMEFWYYSDRGLKGPFVKFLFRKVNDWRGPRGRSQLPE